MHTLAKTNMHSLAHTHLDMDSSLHLLLVQVAIHVVVSARLVIRKVPAQLLLVAAIFHLVHVFFLGGGGAGVTI